MLSRVVTARRITDRSHPPAEPVGPRSFDYVPARYNRYTDLVGAEVWAWLGFRLPRPGQTGRALDAGCGTGTYTSLLADRFNEVLAVDLSTPMIDHARRHRPRGNIRYEVRDLRAVTPDTDGWFDAIVCTNTLHHLGDVTSALWHLRSLVRPGGTVLLADTVDEQGTPSRPWLRRQAWRQFASGLRHGRSPREAVELLRLSLDRDWLDHQTTERLLPPADSHQVVRSVFPGADLATYGRIHALSWFCATIPNDPWPHRMSGAGGGPLGAHR